jgi:hypothetical protein
MTKNIHIGGDRWVRFKRDARGNWCGAGYGLRFKLSQIVGSPRHAPRGPRETWHCAVWDQLAGKLLATCRAHTLKIAVQEGARLADLTVNTLAPSTDPEPCPT